jgi:hypothetical protein
MRRDVMSSLKAEGFLGRFQLWIMWALVAVVLFEAMLIWYQVIKIEEAECREDRLEARIKIYEMIQSLTDNDQRYIEDHAEGHNDPACSLE